MTLNGEKKSTDTKLKLTKMFELTEKDSERVIITLFQMFK